MELPKLTVPKQDGTLEVPKQASERLNATQVKGCGPQL